MNEIFYYRLHMAQVKLLYTLRSYEIEKIVIEYLCRYTRKNKFTLFEKIIPQLTMKIIYILITFIFILAL
jgi:hypothetical protein